MLGDEWFLTLRQVTMDIKELYMRFIWDSHTHTLKRLQTSSLEIISSHMMDKLLNKVHPGVIAQFHAINFMQKTIPTISLDNEMVLFQHH